MNCKQKRIPFVLSFFCIVFTPFFLLATEEETEFRKKIISDWERQEQQQGRDLASAKALSDLVIRSESLLAHLQEEELISDKNTDDLKKWIKSAKQSKQTSFTRIESLKNYTGLRTQLRKTIFDIPLIKNRPLVFLKGNRFVCQMLHEYMSYYYEVSGMNGGGLSILRKPGSSFETESLTDGKFPKGIFSTPSLSFDGKTLYFAFADLSQVQSDGAPILNSRQLAQKGPVADDFFLKKYMLRSEGKFHLFQMDLATGKFKQLTDGPEDDFNPIPLPDGDLVFLSTRRGGFGRCHGGWEPLAVHTLHKLRKDGSIELLSAHETNEWHPTLNSDGRILYCRWDYVDRNASQFHGLWITNPDGTGTISLFGNYTKKINACYQPKQIPGSRKILFIAGAHHLNVGGSLALFDPSRIQYDPQTAEDTLDCIERLTPEIPFPETPDQCPESYYFSPEPLTENLWLVSYSHDPLGGMLSKKSPCTTGRLGLYYRDRFGNLELICDDPNWSCQYPMQITQKDVPRTIASVLPEKEKSSSPAMGTFLLSNVRESLTQIPNDRKITDLRIFQILPKYPGHRSDSPKIGYSHSGNARLLLGSVPVEEDGSAHFIVPANKPIYFQAIDENGKAVQTMRSEVYLRPGENRGCVGCHEQNQTTFRNLEKQSLAAQREPSVLIPGPDGTKPFSYPRLIQPILDRSCLSCHHDKKTGIKPDLSGHIEKQFTISYNRLKPYLKWYEWGKHSIRAISTLPGQCGADLSPLTALINDQNHKGKISLSEKDRRTLYLWMDANADFYGVYDPIEQKKQQRSESVSVPDLQ